MIGLIEVADKVMPVSQFWLWGGFWAMAALLISLIGKLARIVVGYTSIFMLLVVVSGPQDSALQEAAIRELGVSYLINEYAATSLPLIACLVVGPIRRLILRVTGNQPNKAMQRIGLRPTADRPDRYADRLDGAAK